MKWLYAIPVVLLAISGFFGLMPYQREGLAPESAQFLRLNSSLLFLALSVGSAVVIRLLNRPKS